MSSSTRHPRPPGGEPLRRFLPAVALLMLGGLATSWAVQVTADDERLRARLQVQRIADDRLFELSRRIESTLGGVRSIRAFFDSSSFVDREEFRSFCAPLLEAHPEIFGLGWAARVDDEGADELVARAHADGLDGYRLHELPSAGGPVPEAERAERFPLVYVEPMARNSAALGLDLGSESARRAALDAACIKDSIVITERVRLVIDDTREAAFLVALPIFERGAPHRSAEERRAALLGFATGVFRLPSLVEATLVDPADAREDVAVIVQDLSAPPEERVLFARGVDDPGAADDFPIQHPLVLGGRTWWVSYDPAPRMLAQAGRDQVLVVLLVGLALTLLASAFVHGLVSRSRMVERQVTDRTAELEAAVTEIRQLERFFELSVDKLCIAGSEGFLKRANPAWSASLGWSTEELMKRPFYEFLHPDDVHRTAQEIAKLTTGAPTVSFENRYRCADGSYRDFLWTSSPDTETGMIFSIARDITERKRAENKIIDQSHDLARRNREIEEFYHTVSHELKTPLTSAREFVCIVLDGLGGPISESQREYLEIARESCSEMSRSIDDLLDVTRLETGKMSLSLEHCDPAHLARQVVTAMEPVAREKEIRLTTEIDGAPPIVMGDPTRINQVLRNLIGNAIKFSPEGSEVTVGVRRTGDDRVGLSVHDRGCGIPADQVDSVFDRLHQVREDHYMTKGGLGLGLNICRELVALHGGEIWVESRLGEGSTFWFTVPVALEDPVAPTPSGGSLS